MTKDMQNFFDRGGFESTLQAQEMGKIDIFKKFYDQKKGIFNLPERAWKGYWRKARLSTDYREAILRYSAYLDYLEQMKKGKHGLPKNYGASLPQEVMAISKIEDRAYKMSNELLGAYDDISPMGQTLRRYWFPFWSWKEVNMKRYARFYKNAYNDGKIAQTAGRQILGSIKTTPYKAYRIGKFALKASALWAATQAWNHTMYPEEEKSLPESIRNRPHIVFGRNEQGKVIGFTRIGALGDILEWFGLDAAPEYVDKYFSGKMTLKEIAKEMAKSPINVMVQGSNPYVKTPAELITRRALFPDTWRPRTIRNRGLHVAQSLGLGEEYKAITGLPSKKYRETLGTIFYYEIDPGQSSYSDIFEEKNRFLKKQGKLGEGFWLAPRGDALYNWRLAIRYKDTKAAQDYLDKYFLLGGDPKGLERSLENMHPLSGLNKGEELAFVAQLNEEDKDKLVRAIKFYYEDLLGLKEEKK
jgi:hypothetical protein